MGMAEAGGASIRVRVVLGIFHDTRCNRVRFNRQGIFVGSNTQLAAARSH